MWWAHLTVLAGCHGSAVPSGVDPVVDCAVRKLALEYSTHLLPGSERLVSDALELTRLCNTTSPPPADKYAHCAPDISGTAFFVDSVVGDDKSGTGSESLPYRSIDRAVTESRAVKQDQRPVSVVLRDSGTHYLVDSVTLLPEDSGLHLVSFKQERPVVSGGRKIR
jgi:hypothetical protein